MKKQILACAVASAFASGAFAANVTLYGSIDTGLLYTYYKGETESESSWVMQSRTSPGSRWGIKGSEELGNGYSVSFNLESGFNSDDGSLEWSNRIFNRESRLTVAGPFGELSFGNMGSLTSCYGAYNIFMHNVDVFDGGWTVAIGSCNYFYATDMANNMITYATPSISGFKGYAQYSFKVNSEDDGTEGKNSSERFAAVGLTYENGPLAAVAIFSANLAPSWARVVKHDSHTISLGASYDFDVAKIYAAYQYGTNQIYAGGYETTRLSFDYEDEEGGAPFDDTAVKGHNFHLGVSVPLCSGVASFGAYYTTVKSESDYANTLKTYNVAATYTYPLSKRTHIYAGAGYLETKFKSATRKVKEKEFDLTVGLQHTF